MQQPNSADSNALTQFANNILTCFNRSAGLRKAIGDFTMLSLYWVVFLSIHVAGEALFPEIRDIMLADEAFKQQVINEVCKDYAASQVTRQRSNDCLAKTSDFVEPFRHTGSDARTNSPSSWGTQ